MDASASEQLSMQDYFAQPKGRKIAMIVFGVLTALLMAGASFASKKPMTEPVRMARMRSTARSTYAYLDIQLLSGWTLRATGDSNYTYYEAMDPDENWFIVALDDTTAEQLQPYTDAYNYFYTDGAPEAPVPEPTRITGMTYSISSDNIDSLASSYSVTSDGVHELFRHVLSRRGHEPRQYRPGAVRHRRGVQPDYSARAARRLRLRAQKLSSAVTRGSTTWARPTMPSLNSRTCRTSDLSAPSSYWANTLPIVGETGVIAALEDVAWLYKRQQRSHGVVVSTQLMAGLKNGTFRSRWRTASLRTS